MRKISLSEFQILHDIIRVYLKDKFLLKSAAPNIFFKTISLLKGLGFYDSFNLFSAGLTAKFVGTEWRSNPVAINASVQLCETSVHVSGLLSIPKYINKECRKRCKNK